MNTNLSAKTVYSPCIIFLVSWKTINQPLFWINCDFKKKISVNVNMLLVYHTAARVSQELASKWQTPRLKNWASLEMTSLHFLGYKSNSVQHTLETANILFAFQAATSWVWKTKPTCKSQKLQFHLWPLEFGSKISDSTYTLMLKSPNKLHVHSLAQKKNSFGLCRQFCRNSLFFNSSVWILVRLKFRAVAVYIDRCAETEF